VSISLAVVFGLLALVRTVRGPSHHRPIDVADVFDEPAEVVPYLSPLRWPPLRLVSFAAVNVALAVGVNAGFVVQAALR
jgi:hypothetical protein